MLKFPLYSNPLKTLYESLLLISILLVFALFIVSCKPSEEAPSVTLVVEVDDTPYSDSPVIVLITNAVTFPSDLAEYQFYFDWENLETMPTEDGNPPILTPWSDQANRAFSEDIRFDIKKEDGWELYTTSFTNVNLAGLRYVILYNKYRGIMRYYYYIDCCTEGISNNKILASLFKVEGNDNSPLMVFASQKIIDLGNFESFSSAIENQITVNQTWYAVEFEMAFDKNIYEYSHNDISFSIKTVAQALNPMIINNLPLFDSPGKIQVNNLNFTGISTIWAGEATLNIRGTEDLLKATSVLTAQEQTEIQDILQETSYAKIFNGNFQQGNTGKHLKWGIDIGYNNTVNGALISNLRLNLSGADNSQTIGLGNFYNEALGVFYLNQKPVVKYRQSPDQNLSHQYELDVTSVEYLFNPSVLEIAEISNIRQEIIADDSGELRENLEKGTLYAGQKLNANLPLTIQGVRVSFDVLPKDGGRKVHIVKTFRAEVRKL